MREREKKRLISATGNVTVSFVESTEYFAERTWGMSASSYSLMSFLLC